jgi:hypothetical protein
MEPRGSAAEPFSSSSAPVELPPARLAYWAGVAARLGAGTEIPTQETFAA